jgi:hypothetical protein
MCAMLHFAVSREEKKFGGTKRAAAAKGEEAPNGDGN